MHIILSSYIKVKLLSTGKFTFHGVHAQQTYLLELTHPSLHFDPVTIETFFGGESQSSVKVTPYLTDHLYRKGAKLKYPL